MTETDTRKAAEEAIAVHIRQLRTQRDEIDRQIDAAIEAGRRLNGGTQAPPQEEKSAPAKSTTGRSSSKAAAKPKAKSRAATAVSGAKAAAYARRDRLAEWLGQHPGSHRPTDVRKALGYASQAQLGADMAGLQEHGRAAIVGTGRGATYEGASIDSGSAEGKADGAEPEPVEVAVPESVDVAEPEETPARRAPASRRHEPDPVVDRGERIGASEKQNRAVTSYFREHPNSTAKDCAAALGIEQGECRRLIRNLAGGAFGRGRALWSDQGEPPRYRATPEVTQADSSGARTQQEREIVNALRGMPGLRGVELAEWLHRPPEQLSGVLMALVRRGVLTCESGQYDVVEPEPEKVAA